jgi:hypothetical protein
VWRAGFLSVYARAAVLDRVRLARAAVLWLAAAVRYPVHLAAARGGVQMADNQGFQETDRSGRLALVNRAAKIEG